MSQNSDDLTTQPTATVLMERVREVELRLAHDIDILANRVEGQLASFREGIVSSVQDQISSLREEMMKSFYKLNNRVITLTEDSLDMRSNQREILKRLYDPEFTEKTR